MKTSTKAQLIGSVFISIGVTIYRRAGYLEYRESLKSGEQKIWKAAGAGEETPGENGDE